MNILSPSATLSPEDSAKLLILGTSDGKRFSCPKDVMCTSALLKEMLDDADEEEMIELSLPNIDHATLSCIYEFMDHQHHHDKASKELERPLKADLKALVDPWQWKFIEDSLLEGKGESNNQLLFSVLNGANFLGVSPLVDLCAAAIANMVRNKSEQEILDLFGVDEPFTKEREEELCKDFPWLRERPNV